LTTSSSVPTSQERKWRKRGEDLLIELIGFFLTTFIAFVVAQKFIKGLVSEASFWIFIAVLLLSLAGWSLVHFFRKATTLERRLKALQIDNTRNEIQNYLAKFNIQSIYPNRVECNKIIQEKIKQSSTIRFFLLIGSELAEKRGIYAPAFQEKEKGDANVQILIVSPNSPFLSTQRINAIREDGKKSRKFMLNTGKHVEERLRVLQDEMKRKGITLEWRKHSETFLCKFILFDDAVIFCFNIVTSDNDKISPYFVIQRSNEHSIYNAFKMYFDLVWSRSVKPPK
jgi:hypothetical protein